MSDHLWTTEAGTLTFRMPPEPEWEWCLGGNWFALTVRPSGKVPNWFHRLMLRWCLGIHWRRVTPQATDTKGDKSP
jgi:hypothetical protein